MARALELAGEKLSDFAPELFRLVHGDVTRLDSLPDLRPPYDLVIDIGCGHSIDRADNAAYARGIAERLREGGDFMLYASHPRPDSTVGWTPKQVERLFQGKLELYLGAARRRCGHRRALELVSLAEAFPIERAILKFVQA